MRYYLVTRDHRETLARREFMNISHRCSHQPLLEGQGRKYGGSTHCPLEKLGRFLTEKKRAAQKRSRTAHDPAQHRIEHSTLSSAAQDPTQHTVQRNTGSDTRTAHGPAQHRIKHSTGSNREQCTGSSTTWIQHSTGSSISVISQNPAHRSQDKAQNKVQQKQDLIGSCPRSWKSGLMINARFWFSLVFLLSLVFDSASLSIPPRVWLGLVFNSASLSIQPRFRFSLVFDSASLSIQLRFQFSLAYNSASVWIQPRL